MVSPSPDALVTPRPPVSLGPNTKATCSSSGQSLSSRSPALRPLTHSPGPNAFWSLSSFPSSRSLLTNRTYSCHFRRVLVTSHMYISAQTASHKLPAQVSTDQIPKPGTRFKFHIRFKHSPLAMPRPMPSALPMSLRGAHLTPSPSDPS